MGGTSTDVCAIVEGRARREHEQTVGGFPVRLPTLAVHTVGAGGGSIVWVDRGGALHVGPESAGADPGPACYGKGGQRATVTDANLLLGRLPETLAGGIELDRAAAEQALGDLDPAAVIEVVERGDGARAPCRLGRAGARPARLRARRVRRRRPLACVRARGGARDEHCPGPRGSRGALRARVGGRRGAPRPRAVVPRGARGRRRASGRGRGRYPVRGPVVRAHRRARTGSPGPFPHRTCRQVRILGCVPGDRARRRENRGHPSCPGPDRHRATARSHGTARAGARRGHGMGAGGLAAARRTRTGRSSSGVDR